MTATTEDSVKRVLGQKLHEEYTERPIRYHHSGILTVGQTVEMAKQETVTAGLIMRLLRRLYPGQQFRVVCSINKFRAFARVSIPHLHDKRHAFTFDLPTAWASPNEMKRCVLKAGGEMLERFGLPRDRYDVNRYLEIEHSHPFRYRMRVPD